MPDWPVWASVVAVVIVALAAFCAVRHSHRALGALWAIARRKTPPRLLWAFRSIRVPRVVERVACIALLYATAAAAGAGVTTWAMARGAEPQMATVPTSVIVPLAPATARPVVPPPAPVTFVRAIVPMLERQGLTRRQAVLFVAHLARETGWGRWVRGNNFGNIKAGRGWTGPTFTLTDARGFTGQYRAWPTIEQGVESTLALVRDSARYRKAWKLLRAGDVRWYGQLGLDGYYEGPTGHAQDGSRFHTEHDLATVQAAQHEYESIVALATQYKGSDT
jgi:hypothetical protein